MLSSLVGFGRHTITGLLRTQNRQQQDWTADYRFYAQERFDDGGLFDLVRKILETHLDKPQPLVTTMDDSLLRKTGRKVYGVRYLRDPLGPPFQVNFVRGLRVLQISAALPDGTGAARMVPVDFQHAVLPPKPSRKAGPEEIKAYQEERAKRNINKLGLERIQCLRQQMDQSGSAQRQLITTVDGRFTNSTVFKSVPERTALIGRLRKDAVLHFLPQAQPEKGRKRKYGSLAPTPEQLLQDETAPWQVVRAGACGKMHEFKIKGLPAVVMRMNGAAMTVQIMVIKPLDYRLTVGGKLLYRQPAFLVCTDPGLSLEEFGRGRGLRRGSDGADGLHGGGSRLGAGFGRRRHRGVPPGGNRHVAGGRGGAAPGGMRRPGAATLGLRGVRRRLGGGRGPSASRRRAPATKAPGRRCSCRWTIRGATS